MPATPRLNHQLASQVREALTPVTGLTLDVHAVAAHVIAPAQLAGVTSSRGLEEGRLVHPWPTLPIPHRLDVQGFTDGLHAALKDSVAGYAMQLRQHGTTIETLQWNWAKTPTDGSEGWTPEVKMHVASVSKLVTAMAMTKLLDAHGIAPDTAVIGYLPTYWATGAHIGDITFRHLMTHTSGFNTGGSASDYGLMKSTVAAGVAGVGTYHYENMNFGLCRILLATINGNVAPGTRFSIPFLSEDVVWDYVTTTAYVSYLQQNVFGAACVTGATLTHPDADALAYDFPVSGGGWNSGDLTSMAGGAGWHLSVDDLLAVMNDFRRVGNIVATAQAQGMLDSSFGIDLVLPTAAGTLYNKNGFWQDGSGQMEQSLAYFLPEDMELVVLTNSPVTAAHSFFRDIVTDLYVNHLVPIFYTHVSVRDRVNEAVRRVQLLP